jgi:NHLM bacteriocin system ABC transporter peptidase/ATP-binding protein
VTIREQVRAILTRRPLKTRTLLQMEAVECGAAALGSILGYYGRVVSLEELRVQCGVSRDGVTAKNIVRAARKYGLVAKGFKRTFEGLGDTKLPAILFWNFNHFLVLEGIVGDQVFLNDPATGPRRVSLRELDESFTGVVLTFEPGPDFVPAGEEPRLVEALADRIRGSETAVLFAVIAGLALVGPGLLVPTFARVFVDRILVARLDSWVRPLLLGMALTALMRGALTWLRSHYLLRLERKVAIANGGRFFWHVLRLPVEFYAQRYAGEISSRVALTDKIAQMLSGRLATTAIDVVMVVFYGALMLMYDWALTLVGVSVVALNFLVMRLVSEQRVDGNRRLLQEAGKMSGAMMSGLANIETLKATSRESDFFAAVAGHEAKVEGAAQELAAKTQVMMSAPAFLTALSSAAVLAFGGYRVMRGDLTMGMLIAFQSLLASFVGPVGSLVGLASQLQELQGDMNRLDDVFRYPIDAQVAAPDVDPEADQPGMPRSDRLSGKLELRGVTFGYSILAEPLLDDLTLTLEPGSRVALVGPSGCGKSTIAKLVTRLYEPWEGEVLYDGAEPDHIPRAVFASSVSFVDQDLRLFKGSIRDNLTLWDDTVSDDDLVRAAKDALIHDAITARPGGYDSELEEGGANFSGGQRQRLDIARALATNPRILILDEATSALDTLSEQQIDEAIRRRGCTCLIVAHRLSTIRDADEIIVLDRGRVVQRGSHETLLREPDSLYGRLIQA